jgi:hypothetical protein
VRVGDDPDRRRPLELESDHETRGPTTRPLLAGCLHVRCRGSPLPLRRAAVAPSGVSLGASRRVAALMPCSSAGNSSDSAQPSSLEQSARSLGQGRRQPFSTDDRVAAATPSLRASSACFRPAAARRRASSVTGTRISFFVRWTCGTTKGKVST